MTTEPPTVDHRAAMPTPTARPATTTPSPATSAPAAKAALCIAGALAAALASCTDDAPAPRVSRDPHVQLRFEMATKLHQTIERRRQARAEIYGDCKMARALFVRELRRSADQRSRALAAALTKICAGADKRVGSKR